MGFCTGDYIISRSSLPERAAALWLNPLRSRFTSWNTLMSPTPTILCSTFNKAETMNDYYSTSSLWMVSTQKWMWNQLSGPPFIPFTTVAILTESIFVSIVIFLRPTSLWSGQPQHEPDWNYVTAWCLWAAVLCEKQDVIVSCAILEIHSHKDESLFSSRLWRWSHQLWRLPELQMVSFISENALQGKRPRHFLEKISCTGSFAS